MHYIQVISDGCSRWSRYLSDNYTDAADDECDDNDYLSPNASHANLTASSADQFHGQQAASKLTWLALLLFHMRLSLAFSLVYPMCCVSVTLAQCG